MKLNTAMKQVLLELGTDADTLAKERRREQVEDLWCGAITKYWGAAAAFVLAHTNAVYLLQKDGCKQLLVYLDEATCRADVKAREGFLRNYFAQAGEAYERAQIYSSTGAMKNRHPFTQKNTQTSVSSRHERELTEDERKLVITQAATIEDTALRRAFLEAFAATLKYDS